MQSLDVAITKITREVKQDSKGNRLPTPKYNGKPTMISTAQVAPNIIVLFGDKINKEVIFPSR